MGFPREDSNGNQGKSVREALKGARIASGADIGYGGTPPFNVEIHRNETSQPIVYSGAINAYTKGNVYCVLFTNKEGSVVTHKYPLCSLFRIEETYEGSKR